MKPEELADSLEEVFAYDGLATDSPQAIWLADNYKAILSALRRIEKLEAALEIIAGQRPCIDNLMGNADIARQALYRSHND